MPKTEIYQIPGNFNTPPQGWPRLEPSDLSRGLIEDWVADDLIDTFPVTGWASRVSSLPLVVGATEAPPIVADDRGHKAVRFTSNSLRNNSLSKDWQGEITIEVVMNPTEGQSAGGRVISGPSGGFRGIYMYTNSFSLTSSQATGGASTVSLGNYVPGQKTTLIGRWGNTQADGKVYGKAGFSSPLLLSEPTPQAQLFIGANSANPPAANTFLKADIYRIRVWNRVLSNGEADAAMAESAETYGF